MSRIRGDVEDAVDADLFQRFGVLLWIAAEAATTAAAVATQLAAAIANEYQLYLLSKTGCVVDIVQGDATAAEETEATAFISITIMSLGSFLIPMLTAYVCGRVADERDMAYAFYPLAGFMVLAIPGLATMGLSGLLVIGFGVL